MNDVFFLLFVFAVKHFVCDYPLQSHPYFLGKFADRGWLAPLLAHSAVHGAVTATIAACLAASPIVAVGLGVLDLVAHAVMDRAKASRRMLGRWKSLSAREYPTATAAERLENALFWNALGFDQLWHHATDLLVCYLLVRHLGLGA